MSTPPPGITPQRFKLRIQAAAECTRVVCSGRLTAEIAAEFKQEIRALIPQTRRIVLDLDAVGFIDSSGLGALIGVYVTARKSECELQLANLSKKVRELLGIANLLSVFETAGQCGTRII